MQKIRFVVFANHIVRLGSEHVQSEGNSFSTFPEVAILGADQKGVRPLGIRMAKPGLAFYADIFLGSSRKRGRLRSHFPFSYYIFPFSYYIFPLSYYIFPFSHYIFPFSYYIFPLSYYIFPFSYYIFHFHIKFFHFHITFFHFTFHFSISILLPI